MWNFIPKIYVCSIEKEGDFHSQLYKKLVYEFKIPENKLQINILPRLNYRHKDDDIYKHISKPFQKGVDRSLSCSDNHLQVYRDAIQNKYPFVLVFEDDVYLRKDSDLQSSLNFVEKFINENYDWDIIYLGYFPFYLGKDAYADSVFKMFKSKSFCTHAYIISEKYMKRMLLLTPEDIVKQISMSPKVKYSLTRGVFKTGGIDVFFNIDTDKTYSLYPQIFLQDSIPKFENFCLPAEKICHLTKSYIHPLFLVSLIIFCVCPNPVTFVIMFLIFDFLLYLYI